MFNDKRILASFATLIVLVFSVATINYGKSLQQNNAKLPPDLEDTHKFRKWIGKWKERFPQIEADTFKQIDDGEIISSTNPRYSVRAVNESELLAKITDNKDQKHVVIAPDKRQLLDFRKYFLETKEATSSYVYYYGVRENKIIEGPIYECKRTKCWFDRPFFETPDLFYLPEIQEKVYPEDPTRCSVEKICAYEMFLHEFDLKGNKRKTYVSTQLLADFEEVLEALDDL